MERDLGRHRMDFGISEGGGDGPDITIGGLKAKEDRFDAWTGLWPEMETVFSKMGRKNVSPDSVVKSAWEIIRKTGEALSENKKASPETPFTFALKVLTKAAYFAINEGNTALAERFRDEMNAYLRDHSVPMMRGEIDTTLLHVIKSADFRGLSPEGGEELLKNLFASVGKVDKKEA